MEQNVIRGALDFSWNEAVFAMMRGDELLVRENRLFSGRDASALPEWIASAASKGGGAELVREWSIGAGPGSFSGLRIASAFIMGLAYGKRGVRVRGASTAAAMAATAFPSGARPEKVLVLFDGKRSEIIGCGVTLRGSFYEPDGCKGVFRNGEELRAGAGDRILCALEKDSAALESFDVPVKYTASIHADELILQNPEDFSNPPTALEYLRAAVFVPPRTPRKIV